MHGIPCTLSYLDNGSCVLPVRHTSILASTIKAFYKYHQLMRLVTYILYDVYAKLFLCITVCLMDMLIMAYAKLMNTVIT